MTSKTRRQFLEESMLAAAAVAASGAGTSFGDVPLPSRSSLEQLGVAVIGVRGRGNSHIGFYAGRRDTRVLYVCDADRQVGNARVAQVANRQGGVAPRFEEDLRRVLDDPRVDIVSIATPNHWHALGAIWAMQAGKDVYVEVPVSHNVSEGRRMVEAARRYRRICQAGMQARSNPGMIAAIEFVRSGRIGPVRVARGLSFIRHGGRRAGGLFSIPQSVNYDLWLGPARATLFGRPRFHHDWRWQWPYGSGEMGNQSVHQLDLCRWGLAVPSISRTVLGCGPGFGPAATASTIGTQLAIHDFGDKSLVLEARRQRGPAPRRGRAGVIFEGADGFVVMTSYHSGTAFDQEGRPIQQFQGGGGIDLHIRNFIQGVRQRNCIALSADIEEGHISSALCHTGNVSYRLGRDEPLAAARDRLTALVSPPDGPSAFDRVEQYVSASGVGTQSTPMRIGAALTCDPAAETFVDNQKADCLLTRVYRRPFVVPAAGSV